MVSETSSISEDYDFVVDILPPPDLTCPHGLSSATFFSHVVYCRCVKRSENGILSAYVEYVQDPTPATEKEYLDTQQLLKGSRIADALVDGIRLRDDDNHYACAFSLERMHSYKSERSLRSRFAALWRRMTSKY